MRTSPRRPLILKRRKLSLPVEDAAAARRPATKDQTDGRYSAVHNGQHPTDAGADTQKVPSGIKIMNHPTMPNTQVVFIPKHADIQSIIAALTAKGKECGSTGPNKFILISGGGALHPPCPQETQGQTGQVTCFGAGGIRHADCEEGRGGSHKDVIMEDDALLHTVKHLAPESHQKPEVENNSGVLTNCTLDESLTNIQWLGKMSSDGLGSCDVKQELENKENQAPERECTREEDVSFNPSSSSFSAWQKSISERPPYSYMAMIQFAINSTERKRMTLKEIYTWIEDHFPYFKHVAKPGWKNSIRHNLSLHDMFVRETSANGKISFWTIHPDANRCLTLDQVFKPMDQDTQLHLLPSEPQQKRLLPELQKSVTGGSGLKSEVPGGIGASDRKMKLLLPRVNSYFVPFQFPLNQAFVQQPPGKASVSSVSTADLSKASKRVQIAPKIPSAKEDSIAVKNTTPTAAIKEEVEFEVAVEVEEHEQEVEEMASTKLSCPRENIYYTALKSPAWKMPNKQVSMFKDGPLHSLPAKETTSLAVKDSRFSVLRADVPLSCWKEDDRTLYASKSPARKIPDMQVIRRRKGGSRRKQHLVIPCAEEPLLFPECSNCDSGLVSDFSFLQETQALEPSTDFSCTQETFSFKTPIKDKLKLPASSTPSKPIGTAPPAGGFEPWRVTSLNKDADLPDFSPVRLPQGTTLTPLKDTLDLLGFSSPPFNDLPLFDSPQQLLNKSPEVTSGHFTNSPTFEPLTAKRCAKELQIGSSTNRSLTEGLVLDTMNDSLSKILLDISFSGLEDDEDFERDNVSWSQFIPELR